MLCMDVNSYWDIAEMPIISMWVLLLLLMKWAMMDKMLSPKEVSLYGVFQQQKCGMCHYLYQMLNKPTGFDAVWCVILKERIILHPKTQGRLSGSLLTLRRPRWNIRISEFEGHWWYFRHLWHPPPIECASICFEEHKQHWFTRFHWACWVSSCWLMAQILMHLALVPVKVNIACDPCLNALFEMLLVCETLCTLK